MNAARPMSVAPLLFVMVGYLSITMFHVTLSGLRETSDDHERAVQAELAKGPLPRRPEQCLGHRDAVGQLRLAFLDARVEPREVEGDCLPGQGHPWRQCLSCPRAGRSTPPPAPRGAGQQRAAAQAKELQASR